MTDLNEWNLSYTPLFGGAVNYDFGHSINNSPLTVQADIGDPERIVADAQHGTDNAQLMGRDLLGGMDITFNITTLPDPTGSGVALNALDKVSEFGSKWRAPGLAKTPGSYATLTNKLRNRFVIGRPRQFSPKHARVRKGVSEYLAVFHTVSPDFYKNPINSLQPARTVSTPRTINGDLPAWPIITFTGLFTTASLTWTPPAGFGSAWTITINHAIASNIPVVVDTRPWARTAKDNGGIMQNGWLAGSKMGDAFLVPSTGGTFLFTTTGTVDGNTKAVVTWYDTYAGL